MNIYELLFAILLGLFFKCKYLKNFLADLYLFFQKTLETFFYPVTVIRIRVFSPAPNMSYNATNDMRLDSRSRTLKKEENIRKFNECADSLSEKSLFSRIKSKFLLKHTGY